MKRGYKKNNKKTHIIIIIILILVIILAIAGIFGRDFIQKRTLIKEVNNIVENKDLSVDTVNTDDIKTSGEYAKVEKAIKTYLNDYAIEIQKIISIAQDEKVSSLLSINNYEEDGPEFTKTLSFIDETKKQLEECSEKTIALMEKDKMFKYIENYNLSEKYNKLFETLMLDEDTEKELKQIKEDLQESITKIEGNLQVANDTINFLNEHKREWSISNNTVLFNSQNLVDQYNELIGKLK